MDVFENAAARDSRIPKPTVGQDCMLVDTGEVLHYYGQYLGWRPAWNSAWGDIGVEEIFSPVTVRNGSATGNFNIGFSYSVYVVQALQVTFTPIARREYEAIFDGVVVSGVDGDFVTVAIAVIDPTGALVADRNQTYIITGTGVTPVPAYLSFRFSSSITSPGYSYTVGILGLSLTRDDGAIYGDGNYGSTLVVRDVGNVIGSDPIYT